MENQTTNTTTTSETPVAPAAPVVPAEIPVAAPSAAVNAGIILGTATITFALGIGAYFACKATADFIKKHRAEKEQPKEEIPEEDSKSEE